MVSPVNGVAPSPPPVKLCSTLSVCASAEPAAINISAERTIPNTLRREFAHDIDVRNGELGNGAVVAGMVDPSRLLLEMKQAIAQSGWPRIGLCFCPLRSVSL